MAIDVQISTKTIKSCCLIFWSHDAEIYLIYIFRKIDICWVDTFTFECNGRKLRSLFVVRDTDKTATFKLELPETDWGVYLHSNYKDSSTTQLRVSQAIYYYSASMFGILNKPQFSTLLLKYLSTLNPLNILNEQFGINLFYYAGKLIKEQCRLEFSFIT